MSAAASANVKRASLFAAKMALSAALFAFLFHRVRLDAVAEVIRHADVRWLLGALGLMFASNVLGSHQWNRLLRAVEVELPFWKVCAYYHVGLFFNNFLPANVGGDFARILDVSRGNASRATALSTVLMDRFVGTIALGALAVVSTLPVLDRFHLQLAYVGVVTFFGLAVFMLWAVFHPAVLPAIERLLNRVGLSRLSPVLEELAQRMSGYRGQRTLLLELFAIAMAVQVMRIGVHVLVSRALGLDVPVTYFFLFVPLLAVIVSLPISLNGIGVREGAGILLFGLVGLDKASAFSLQFTTYLVAVAVSLIGGLVFLVRIPHRRAEARSLRRPGA